MPTLLRSQVLITEAEPRVGQLPQQETEFLAVLGIMNRGPVRTPVEVVGFSEYVEIFGFETETDLQVRQFFLNGGSRAVVSRVVHYADPAVPTPATATRGGRTYQTAATAPTAATILGSVVGPVAVVNGQQIRIAWSNNDGGVQQDLRAQVDVVAAQATTVNAENYNFTAAGVAPWRFTVAVDGGTAQTIDLLGSDFANAAAATAEEVAAGINRQMTGAMATVIGGTTVRITSDRLGTGSIVDIGAGVGATDANGVLAFPLAAQTGTGSFSRVGGGAGLGAISSAAAVSIAEFVTGLGAVVTDFAPPGGNSITFTADSGRLRITTQDASANARLAVPDRDAGDAIDMVIATTLGFALTDATGGLDMTAPVEANVQIGTSGAAVNTLRVEGKYEGAYSGLLQIEITAATSGAAAEFDLVVYRSGIEVDSFRNLTMDSTAARYVETIIGDSGAVLNGQTQWIRAVDQTAAGTATQRRPANTVAMPASPFLDAGNDGLAALADADFSGSAVGLTGLHAFNATQGIRLIICPARTTTAFQDLMANYAEVTRQLEAFAIFDPPAGQNRAAIVAHVGALAATEFAALYWPRIRVTTPNASFGTERLTITGVSGSIAGRMAANSFSTKPGPFTQPANVDFGKLVGAVDLETDDHEVLNPATRDVVFPLRINPIMKERNRPVYADGARTLLATGNFPSIGERRGVSDIEAVIRAGVNVYRHRNHTEDLRALIRRLVFKYLLDRTRDGAFASRVPNEAFTLDVSAALNPASVQRLNQLRALVGLATAAPAEFILFEFSRDTRALESEIESA